MAQADWLNREAPLNQALIGQLYAGFLERYRDQISQEHRVVCDRLVESFDGYRSLASGVAHGLVHGDYRLDNMLFGQPGADRPLTVVDWQTVVWGPAMTDVAYFLGGALPERLRRDHYDALLRAYHETLGPEAPISLDDVREGVRRQSFFGVMMAIVAPMLVVQTERGDEMFMTMLRRHCQHVLDTEALEILPEPVVAEPLTPDPADEQAHPAGDEPLWSESWYFDFADPEQGFGGWVRLGLMPNENTTWINVLLCGPDMPTIALVDFHDTVRDRTHPGRRRTPAAPYTVDRAGHRSGLRRSGRSATRSTGPAGRGVDGADLDDGGHPVPVPDHAPIRNPVQCVGERDRRRPRVHAERRAGTARPLLGRARLVVDGLGVERTAFRRRHPCSRGRHPDTRCAADRHRLCATAR